MTINDIKLFNSIVDGYRVADQLVHSTIATTFFFGYVDKDGNWYIEKNDSLLGTWRFIRGKASVTTYLAAWAGREGLSYDYFYNIFNTT